MQPEDQAIPCTTTTSELLVGLAQTGCQIAEELYQSGRKVYLFVSKAGRLPRRYRGKDITWWLDVVDFLDKTVDQLPSPKAKFAASAHGTGKDGGRTINLHQFARDGVVLLGHIQNVQADRIVLVPDLKENLAKADKFETNFVREVVNYIERNGLDAPIDPLPELSNGSFGLNWVENAALLSRSPVSKAPVLRLDPGRT